MSRDTHSKKRASVLCLGVLCALQSFSLEVFGKPLYVTGYREVAVRTGPSAEYSVMATLKTGDEVSLVNAAADYYLVVIPTGSRGYVPQDAVTEQPPPETRLQALAQSTRQRIGELEAKTQQQDRQIAALREEQSRLEAANKLAEARAAQQTKRAEQLQAQQNGVERDLYMRWFLAGGGVFFGGGIFGWIWGAMVRRGRHSGLRLNRL